jgi:formyltetrahydrofolate synthetase
MAILALTDSLEDFKKRVGRIVIGSSKNDTPVTVDDLV